MGTRRKEGEENRKSRRGEELNGGDWSEEDVWDLSCHREGVEVFSLLPYCAIEKGQDPLEVPVRRGEQDLSLLQIPTLKCQPPVNYPKVEPR